MYLKVIDCIVLLCVFSFSVFYFTPVVVITYYQLIDLLHITRLHQFCNFFILKL